ncbi:MAG: LPS assembly lipoprotein LptE [Verrucomicrobiota bacterium]
MSLSSSALPSGFTRCSRFCALGFALTFALFVTGCANYQLGTGGTPSFRTLYIEPVANKTMLPQSQPLLSTRLRETFARDGRVSLAPSSNGADATLTVVINDYHRDVAAVREGDTGLARKFNLTLGATCTLKDNRTGKFIFENRPISAIREAFTDSGQLQSEYQTLPLLAEALATKVAHAALDVW